MNRKCLDHLHWIHLIVYNFVWLVIITFPALLFIYWLWNMRGWITSVLPYTHTCYSTILYIIKLSDYYFCLKLVSTYSTFYEILFQYILNNLYVAVIQFDLRIYLHVAGNPIGENYLIILGWIISGN